MKKCCSTEHPHCTLWVMPGESVCPAGHAQAGLAQIPSSFDMIKGLRRARPLPGSADVAALSAQVEASPWPARPVLHVSGFDPRAAGGRQTLKLELRGLPQDSADIIQMQLQSALLPQAQSRHAFVRTLHGDWRPLFIEFSSRGMEHGQYRIEVELQSEANGRVLHRWTCTLVVLIPRADASLGEIHQAFLSQHKNVRVHADDASIARLAAQAGGGRLDIDLSATNASIAHLDLDARNGKVNLAFATIAWDEDLIEIDVPAQPEPHPHPSRAACLVNAAPESGSPRQVRLFALDECVFGRFEQYDPECDVLLAHYGEHGMETGGLTRRISGRHAVLRRGAHGFEIEDVSRYGILVDGVWPGKYKPVALRLGMRIEFTASVRDIAVLEVTALLAHGVVMHRIDRGTQAECYYFLEPEQHPSPHAAAAQAAPRAAAMPLLFHANGGFWHLDAASGRATALSPSTQLDRLAQMPRMHRFNADPYPEAYVGRSGGFEMYQQSLAARTRAAINATA